MSAPEGLARNTIPLVDIAHDLRRVSHRRDARVLLVIDQFEELLGREQTANAASRFLELLRASIESDKSPLMLLSTMRSDFLGLFQRNAALQGVDFESLSLGPMRIEAMRRVIAMPAKLAAIGLESGLADRLLEDTETADALPLLSFTLWVLCRDRRDDGKLEVSEYEKLGGLQGTITREADAVLASASREHKEDDLRKALLQMARLSEDGSYARLPVSWDNAEIRRVESILETVVERRILVSRMEGDTRIVEVAHEALFRTWRPLKAWLDGMGGGTGRQRFTVSHEGELKVVAFSPNGQFIVTGSDDDTAQLWDVDAGKLRFTLKHQDDVNDVSFSPDGQVLVTASGNTAQLWTVETGQPGFVLSHDGVTAASFSPDGTLVVTTGSGRVQVWEAKTGSAQHTFSHGVFRTATFSPDGRFLVTTSGNTALIWSVSGALLQSAIAAATTVCLKPEFRRQNLGESATEARRKYEACERKHGRER